MLGEGGDLARIIGQRDGTGGDGLLLIWLSPDRYELSWHTYPESERYAYAKRAEELGVEPPFSPDTAKPFWDAYARKIESGGGELLEGSPP